MTPQSLFDMIWPHRITWDDHMEPSSSILERKRRVCYLRMDARQVDRDLMVLESHLKRLGDLSITPVKDLDTPGIFPCDLLIVGAQKIHEGTFLTWFSRFRERMLKTGSIWTPALVLAEVSFDVLKDLLLEAVRDNWYFDIVSTDQISSLPMRVANLLRIHDHLHELKRYEVALDGIQNQVQTLEEKLAGLTESRPGTQP